MQKKATSVTDNHPTSSAVTTPLKDIKKSLPLRVLSPEDWRQWISDGYVIVRQAVPSANVDRLVEVMWAFDEKDPNDPSTWYAPQRRPHSMPELNNTGMIEIYNHQALWDNRQEPRVYDAFVDIWDREDLWVAFDRANLNPPKKVKGNPNGFIHWDSDTSLDPLPIGVQGVLSLKKPDGEVGGFQCVPDLFSNFDDWVKTQPADRDSFHPDTTGLSVVNIEMEAGDLLIWNTLLAHGVRPNHSPDRVRMAQYISMYPSEGESDAERQNRIHLWRELEHPDARRLSGRPPHVGKEKCQKRRTDAAWSTIAWIIRLVTLPNIVPALLVSASPHCRDRAMAEACRAVSTGPAPVASARASDVVNAV